MVKEGKAYSHNFSANHFREACGISVVLQMGREMPVVTMDKSGKLLMATAKDIQAGALRALADEELHDGEVVEISFKAAGPSEQLLGSGA